MPPTTTKSLHQNHQWPPACCWHQFSPATISAAPPLLWFISPLSSCTVHQTHLKHFQTLLRHLQCSPEFGPGGPPLPHPHPSNLSTNLPSGQSLGAILNSTLPLQPHIGHVTRTTYFHLHHINLLRPSLTPNYLYPHLCHWRSLDYSNSLFSGLPLKYLHELVHNAAAHILSRTLTNCPHICHRINSKLLLLTLKAPTSLAFPTSPAFSTTMSQLFLSVPLHQFTSATFCSSLLFLAVAPSAALHPTSGITVVAFNPCKVTLELRKVLLLLLLLLATHSHLHTNVDPWMICLFENVKNFLKLCTFNILSKTNFKTPKHWIAHNENQL